MKRFLAQLKEFWFLIAFLIGILSAVWTAVMAGYVGGIAMSTLKSDAAKLYVQELVAAELLKAGVPGDEVIAEMAGHVDLNSAGVKTNADANALTQSQLQDVARILMQPPTQ